MKVSSSVRPKDVEILESEDNKVIIALRDNILEVTENDLLTSKPLVIYKYDEVKITVRKRDNLLESIKANFVNWFTKGKRLEELELQVKQNKDEIQKLLCDGEQIKINDELEMATGQALMASLDNYEKITSISDDSQSLMLAMLELYEILTGGVK